MDAVEFEHEARDRTPPASPPAPVVVGEAGRPHLAAVSCKRDHGVHRARRFAEAWAWLQRSNAERLDDPETLEWLMSAGVVAPPKATRG
ncbi:MAG: hypothetical protein HY332_04420 [Chloroflexi bacterium]|nr:hypothetical protein [Chloroflexota bacterium]